jgi:subtilase family serine protease
MLAINAVSARGGLFRALLVICVSIFAVSGSAFADPSNIVYKADPPHRLVAPASPGVLPAFPTPSQCVAAFGLACYTPALMRAAYNVPTTSLGAGQTIVIVDAYGSPTVAEDLHIFSVIFGLPEADLEVVYPMGRPAFNPNQHHDETGWAVETSLDVQYAHAIAPLAKIVLVVAPNNFGNALNVAQRYAIDNHLGQVMSLSFGSDEAAINGGGNNIQLIQAHQNYLAALNAGITVFASSGDGGASDGFPIANASYPASDPLVTAVGGTDLFMTDAGAYVGEIVWNDQDACPFGCTAGIFGSTGGAPSKIFAAPGYQSALSGIGARTTSDVSYNAGVYTGVLVYIGFLGPGKNGLYFVGGTSAGAPQWAAIAALVNEAAGQPMGFLNPALYAIGSNALKYAQAFHDVTVGDNKFFGPGFNAGTGYDLPTGLGSPDVTGLINALLGP